MKNKQGILISLGLWLLMVIGGIVAYSFLPDIVDSHWNAVGEVDGQMPKLKALLVTPLIALLIILVQFIMPFTMRSRDKARNLEFIVHLLFIIVMGMVVGFYFYMIAWNMGRTYDSTKILPMIFASLFYVVGIVVSRIEPKISEERMKKLHPRAILRMQRLNGFAFKTASIFMLVGLFFKMYTFYFVIISAIVAVIFAMINTMRTYHNSEKEL